MNNDHDIAILWDAESVTPEVNTLFIDGLREYSEGMGKIALSRAYGDWNKKNLKNLAYVLTEQSFELVHVPSGRKSGSGVSLITGAMEVLFQYPEIDRFVIMSGSDDFRPLLVSLRKHGRETFIICDAKKASEELLALADDFLDYRELLPGDGDWRTTGSEENEGGPGPGIDLAFELLVEAVSDMIEQKKRPSLGTARVRMKLLNRSFDQSDYGFPTWSAFVAAAVDANYISIEEDSRGTSLEPVVIEGKPSRQRLSTAFSGLTETLTKMDRGEEHQFHPLNAVNNRLILNGTDVSTLGFRRFRHFVQAAEVKGLVESKNEKLEYFIKRV